MYRSYYRLETLKGVPWKDQSANPVQLHIVGAVLSDDNLMLDQAYRDEEGKWHEYRGIPQCVHFNPDSAVVIRRIA